MISRNASDDFMLGVMSNDPRRSIVFHRVANFLLLLSAVFAAYLLFVLIIPALDVEWDSRSVAFAISTLYMPVLWMFFISCAIALAILGWRAWLLYIRPRSRSSPRGETETLGAWQRPHIQMPKTWREWMLPISVFGAIGVPFFLMYQSRVDRGEAECRMRCAETGYKSYHYIAPTRSNRESCSCLHKGAQ
jgi:hypothetical protein